MSHLENEIAEQPEVIARLLESQAPPMRPMVAAIREFDPTFVYIAARGTSDNAARYAQYTLGTLAGLPVALAAPSIHTLYNTPPRLSRALAIGISQSGQAADVTKVIEDARAQGALTITITNYPDSPLAQAADYHIHLDAGEEQSVAATKTYTGQLAAVALLTALLTDRADLLEALRQMPLQTLETLRMSERIERWAERYRYINGIAALGRGYNYCTAFEVNLKIQELCYVTGHGYSEADFLHGPIAMVQPGFPVVVIAPKGETLEQMRDLLVRLHAREAETLVISNDEIALGQGTRSVGIPEDIPEWLTPIAAVIPGQVLAMRLAQARGNPLDKPIGLTKVTITR